MAGRTFIHITQDAIPPLDTITQQVQDDGAGAISTFSGTTRDSFQGKFSPFSLCILCIHCLILAHTSIGKQVVQLEYQAYDKMAVKVLETIVQEARERWQLTHVAIYHRTGTVPVGQTSVVVATSSTHRTEAIHATGYLIDELKLRCPIWKKEVYHDGSVWKGSCNGK